MLCSRGLSLRALDTAIKYCEDSHKQTVMIICVGLNPGQGRTLFHLWSGLVWFSDPADNLFTIWFPPLHILNLPRSVLKSWQPGMPVSVVSPGSSSFCFL